MLRRLLASGAIVVVLVCGIWVHAARAPVSPSKAPSPPATHADRVAPAPEVGLVQPAPSVKVPTPTRVVAPKVTAPQLVESQPTESPLSAGMRIPAEVPTESQGPALTIEEMQALARQESEGLVTVRNADGSETLNHEDRFLEYTILKVGPDGQPQLVCVQGEAAMKQAIAPAATEKKQAKKTATPKGDR